MCRGVVDIGEAAEGGLLEGGHVEGRGGRELKHLGGVGGLGSVVWGLGSGVCGLGFGDTGRQEHRHLGGEAKGDLWRLRRSGGRRGAAI